MQKLLVGIFMIPSTIISLFLSTPVIGAETIDIFTDGTDKAELRGIYVDGVRHQHINGTLTKFAMYGFGNDSYQIVPDGWSGQNGTNAVALLEDDYLGTGFTSLRGEVTWDGSQDGVSMTFNEPVTNRPGSDILIFEWNSDDWDKKIHVVINGSDITYTNSGSGVFTDARVLVDSKMWSDQDTPAKTLSALQNSCDFSNGGSSSSDNAIGYLAVDLSDFGVASGAAVNSIRIWQWGAQDIVGIVGLKPDPAEIEIIAGESDAAPLRQIVVDGDELTPVGVNVTGFSMYSTTYTYQFVPSGWSGQNGANAKALLEDKYLGTGFNALQGSSGTGDGGLIMSFEKPVENRPGPDIIVFEWSSTDWGQTIYCVINGITGRYRGTSVYTDSGITVNSRQHHDSNTPATTLSTLVNTCDFVNSGSILSDIKIGYLAIYLEDYGLDEGETASSIKLYQWGGPDIAAVAGLTVPTGTLLILQ